MCKRIIFSSVLLLTLQSAYSFVVFDPTNFAVNSTNYSTNLIASAKAVIMAERMLQQLQNQVVMLQNQAKNLTNLSGLQFDNPEQALNALNSKLQQGQSLAYSSNNLEDRFKQLFPDYGQASTTDYNAQVKDLTQTNQDTMKGALNQLHTSMTQQQQESSQINKLRSDAQGASGNLQVQQVGNEIAAEQVAQMQKMHQTMMTQTNAQVEYYAMQTQKAATQEATQQAVIQKTNAIYPGYQNDNHFGVVPTFGG